MARNPALEKVLEKYPLEEGGRFWAVNCRGFGWRVFVSATYGEWQLEIWWMESAREDQRLNFVLTRYDDTREIGLEEAVEMGWEALNRFFDRVRDIHEQFKGLSFFEEAPRVSAWERL